MTRPVRFSSFLAAAVALVAGSVTSSPLGAQPPPADNILEHFKYGSIGTEVSVGVPFPLWRVLPVVFADKLPSRPGVGWERLGFINEGVGGDRFIGTTNKKG